MVGSARAMPRSSLTSSFSVTDANNEVVCPLRNQDGSSCRKRCLGEKRYRSMQEHIRRAHPEHYISKLPATEESFQLMINTPPSERPPPQASASLPPHGYHERHFYGDGSSSPNTPRNADEYPSGSLLPAASAAAALAQLHNHKMESDWESDGADWMSDTEAHSKAMRSSIELPPMRRPNHLDVTSEPFPALNNRPRELLPSILSTSPPGRSSTLPPIQRHPPARPRKQSVSKRAREPQHKRQKSKEQIHLKRMSYDRKAFSAEPSSHVPAYGKRWEDLLDAATSATEDVNEDRTPVRTGATIQRGSLTKQMPPSPQVPHSPLSINRSSMPPFSASHFQGYQASPLQQALTPPPCLAEAPEPFQSVESFPSGENFPSVESGDNFHMESRDLGLSDSSPGFSSQGIQIYCAACQSISPLKESYACTECICGICQVCVDVLMAEQGARRKCPKCATIGGKFKPFQLDIR